MKLIKILATATVVLLAIILLRTFLHTAPEASRIAPSEIQLNESLLASHLAEAIRFKTISNRSGGEFARDQFDGFINWVATTYPLVTASLPVEQLNYSLLYKWPGTNGALKPILITGHYDVVPVLPGTEEKWQHPPFSGVVENGIIWGRGALDDKSGVIGILEAVSYLLQTGYQPTRTIYLSFGHDEELSGPSGAAKVVETLKERNVQLAWSLDEGSFLFEGLLPGIEGLIAPINVAEKGRLTLDIIASSEGGHSSLPPKSTAVGKLARAITKLENHPLPGGLEGVASEMFDNISRHMSFVPRMLFANQWLFGGLIEKQLSNVAFSNAMLRTTTAPTMLSGSTKKNVLPIEAVATINFRLHPRDTPEGVTEYVSSIVAAEDISVRVQSQSTPSKISDWTAQGFAHIADSVQEVYGDVIITPGLMIAASDSVHYSKIADNAYRLNPFTVDQTDLTGFHGTNEKISVENFARGVRVYIQIIRRGSES
jgi:carboxypeptidase PM20D1